MEEAPVTERVPDTSDQAPEGGQGSPHPDPLPGGEGVSRGPLPGGEGVADPDTRPPSPDSPSELLEVRRRWVESHRRALLAENAGRVVPELVAGETVEELDRSLEVARSAFETARAAALAEVSAARVPAGNPVRQGPNPEAMSPMEKIAYGLKRD